MKNPFGEFKISNPVVGFKDQDETSIIKVEEIDSIMCHVSKVLITDRIRVSDKSTGDAPLIFFTKNEFMSNYGNWIYIFKKSVLQKKYRLVRKGESWHRMYYYEGGEQRMKAEQSRFEEYVSPMDIDIRDAIGVIKHRDLSPKDFKIN